MASPTTGTITPLHAPVVSSRAVPLVVVSTVFQALAVSTIILRFLSKHSNRGVGVDDWFALLALVFSFGLYTTGILISTIGFAGFHMDQLLPEQIERFLLIVYIDNIFYALTLPTIKLSILFMYRRIFHRVKHFQYALYTVGAIVLGWMISVVLTQIFSCNPVDGSWNLVAMATARCINTTKFYYGNAISNLLTDVIILCLPIPMILRLNMTAHKKSALAGVFLLGGFVCISSIVRIVSLSRINNDDITYTLVDVGVWTSIETPLSITCACLPTLPAYFKAWQQKIVGSRGTKATISTSVLRSLRSKNGTAGLASKEDYDNFDGRDTIPLSQKFGKDIDSVETGGVYVSQEFTIERSDRRYR